METQWAGLSVCSGTGAKFEKKMSARLPFVHVECASVCVTERGRGYERYSNDSTSSLSEPQTALKVMPNPHRSHWLDQNPPFLLLSSFLLPSLPCHLLSRSVDPPHKRGCLSPQHREGLRQEELHYSVSSRGGGREVGTGRES